MQKNGGNKEQTADGDGKKGCRLINARSWIRSNKGTEPKGQTSKSGWKKGGAGSICVPFFFRVGRFQLLMKKARVTIGGGCLGPHFLLQATKSGVLFLFFR